MDKRGFLTCLFVFTFAGATAPLAGQEVGLASEDNLWSPVELSRALVPDEQRRPLPRAYRAFMVDDVLLADRLSRAPMEFVRDAATEKAILSLPMPDGTFEKVIFEESPILSEELALEYPDIRTYRFEGLEDPALSGRLDLTSSGFHGILFSERGVAFIDPVPAEPGVYLAYWKRHAVGQPLLCLDGGSEHRRGNVLESELPSIAPQISPNNPSGALLRNYRLAVTGTDEYTAFFAGGVAAARNQIVTTMNRVIGIFAREVSIGFTLVRINPYPNNPLSPDPYTTGGTVNATLLNQHQTDLDTNFGTANYDIGHILTQGGTGGSGPGRTCRAADKARGGTGAVNPSIGDAFDVDFVAHEMGHQLNASHTWTGTTAACSSAQFVANSAYEPGSGSTIMSYAGICNPQNVQANSDAYFHTRSFDEIVAYRDGNGACGFRISTGNSAPIVNANPNNLQNPITIPTATPFTLTANGSDPNGQALTFTWEQFDLGAQVGAPAPTQTTGPLFRSRPGTSTASRTFPRFPDLLSGSPTPWEVLPTVNRSLNFRVTARDTRTGVDWDAFSINVAGSPFAITAPAASGVLECGAQTTLQWNVGGGSVAPNVAASVSTNGTTFVPLVASLPNNGSAIVTMPSALTSTGRIRLDAIGNIFFALSGQYSVTDTVPPQITAPPAISGFECNGQNGSAVPLGSATASDLCSGVTISDDRPNLFPFDSTTVTWTATDASGNSATATQLVEVDDTTPPVIASSGIIAECTSPSGALVNPATGVFDVCDPDPTVVPNSPALFPLGTSTVSVTATDFIGNSVTRPLQVTVVDTTPPTILPPPPFTAECLSPTGTEIDFGTATASDLCDSVPTKTDNAPGSGFPFGVNTVTWTATDDSGNSASALQTVTIIDTTPPTLQVSVSPALLSPPNQTLRTVTAQLTLGDTCDATLTVRLVSIVSNEADSGLFPGDKAGDIRGAAFGTDDRVFKLRAERNPSGTGRVYTIRYEVEDGGGNVTQAVATVVVPI